MPDVCGQIDGYLEDANTVMIVEVKSKPTAKDIDEHIERMEKLRIYADSRNDKRRYLGAIAGVVFNEPERNYALKNGFYVVQPSGKTFSITKPEGMPRVW